MLNEQQLKELKLKLREDRYMYLGMLSEYQTITKNYTQSIDYSKLNQHQHFLFKKKLQINFFFGYRPWMFEERGRYSLASNGLNLN